MDPARPLQATQFLEIDEDWGDLGVWQAIKLYSGRPTPPATMLNAVDLQQDRRRHRRAARASERIYVKLFLRTVALSLVDHLALPAARLPDRLPAGDPAAGTSNLLMILVLLPFWTSLLVRTASWKVVLQSRA